jgi:hypothetical protein
MVTIAWNPLGFHLLDALPKGNRFNAEYYHINILTEFFGSAGRLMGGDSSFMLTTQDPAPPENAEPFSKKIGSASPHTHHTFLISHHPISFSSDMSNAVCREWSVHSR